MSEWRRFGFLLCAVWLAGFTMALPALALQTEEKSSRPATAVYVFSFEHQEASGALDLIRAISPMANVELQPEDNALVVRATPQAIERLRPVLESYDHPPQDVRLEIQVLRSGSGQPAVLPLDGRREAQEADQREVAERMLGALRLDYLPLAKAALTSKEGEEVTYALSKDYSVSFRVGTVLANQRLKLQDFRIFKNVSPNNVSTNKSRRLPPKELFASTINLSLDQQFTLVLAEDNPQQEALMVSISCRREVED